MSEPIKVGDLVVVVRTCCGSLYNAIAGIPWIVNSTFSDSWACIRCGTPGHGVLAVAAEPYGDGHHSRAPISWLKRISPLSELEGEKRDEEITA